jgi:hypothetical protein
MCKNASYVWNVFLFLFLLGGSENSTQIVLTNNRPKTMMHTFSNRRNNSSCLNSIALVIHHSPGHPTTII